MIPLQITVEQPVTPSFKSQTTRAPTIDKEYESFVSIKKTLTRHSIDLNLMVHTIEWRRHAMVKSRGIHLRNKIGR